jgi:LPXTG-motif cell wall-anchored protein
VSPNADFDAGLLGLLAAAASGLFLRRRREGKTE